MIIYQAHNPVTNTFYVGKTVKNLEHRKRQHIVEAGLKRNNSYFHKAIRKYGFYIFNWYVLEETNNKEELSKLEIRWIKLLKDCGHKIYNLTSGGDGGSTNTYRKGKPLSEETKLKISVGLKKYFETNNNPTKGTHPEGRPHTEESKNKIRLSKLGHSVSKETRIKLRDSNLGKKLKPHVVDMLSEKFSGKNNPSAKSVICTTTGETFDYATLAAEKYNVDLSTIIKCCRHKLKHTKGYKFEYKYPAGWKDLGVYP